MWPLDIFAFAGLVIFRSLSPPSCYSFSCSFMLFVHTACTSCFAGGRVISDEPSVSYLMQGGVNCLCEANLAHLCCTWTHLSCLSYGKGLSSVQVNKYHHLERKGNSTDHL